MRHNKVLGLAIASALAIGASPSYAGELTVEYVDDSCSVKAGPAVFASEYFFSAGQEVLDGTTCNTLDNLDSGGVGGPAANGSYDDRYFYATYEFTEKALGSLAFLVRFQLSNGASFSEDVNLAGGTSLDFVAHPSGTHSAVTTSGALGNGGSEGDTQVTFFVTPPQGGGGDFAKGNKLFFRFNLQDLDILSDPGEKIDLTAEVFSGPNEADSFDGGPVTETVATSARATRADVDSASGAAEIDVGTGSINFVGSSTVVLSPTKVKLGALTVADNTSVNPQPMKKDGSAWIFGTDAQLSGGTLTLESTTLSASLTDPGKIFLDFNNNGEYEDTTVPPDVLATTIKDASVAEWELSDQQLKDIYNSASNSVDIVIEADGVTPIDEHREPAKATFQIDYGGPNQDTFTRNLLHIKRNGVVCSLYNVPAPDANDIGNIRITNTSGKAGTVLGSVRNTAGDYVFTNKELIASIEPNQTIRLTADDLCDPTIERNPEWIAKYGDVCWSGRAVLTINSDVKSLEIFGLVRKKIGGGPLTNMSVGATGNGCD